MRYFLAVAEENNFTRAAERCRVSQPSLSKQIQNMERLLHVKLFDRHARHVSISKAGRVFEKEARCAVEHSVRAVALVSALAREEQVIRCGISTLADFPRWHPAIQNAKRYAQGLHVEVETAYTTELLLSVLRGALDAAIVDLPLKANGLRVLPIESEDMVLAIPAGHTLSSHADLSLGDMVHSPLVLLSEKIDPARPGLERALAKAGPRTFKIHEATSLTNLVDRIVLEHCVSVVRRSASRFACDGVVYKSISGCPEVKYGIVWRSDERRSAQLSFIDAVAAFSQQRKPS